MCTVIYYSHAALSYSMQYVCMDWSSTQTKCKQKHCQAHTCICIERNLTNETCFNSLLINVE